MLCAEVLSTLLKSAFALVFSFFTNLSKEGSFNPKGEVTVVLLTPGSLQVFDGKACFGLLYIKVTNPAFFLKRNKKVLKALKLRKEHVV